MSMKLKYSEEELLSLLNTRQERAFEYLYDHYSSALYGVLVNILRNEDDAADLLQEVFIKIWRKIGTYESSRGRLFTWMINIARNSAIDFLRSSDFRNSSQNHELSESVYNSVVDATPHEDYIGLRALTTTLKEEFRVLVDLAYYKGYTHEEIAKELNIPAGTVKTRLRAALLQLRKLMLLILIFLLLWI